ncbi:MAG TPA: hypothetical protein VK638_28785 [Edaphobacter sp.]|jgi:hypothetical protein|nr:hypothetical protein [Edaphobacter sp.]
MSDGREEREEQEHRRRWQEQEDQRDRLDPAGRPYREREWEERGREPS